MGEPHILSSSATLPAHYVDQETLLEAFREQWAEKHFNVERLEQLHRAVRVGGRHLALPLERYGELDSFAKRNDAWIAATVDLGETALKEALLRAELRPEDVDHLYFVTVTGLATPSIDARLVNRMHLRTDLKRSPLFGLGCVAGAAGLARAADAVRAGRNEIAALLAVELCSLTLQRDDLSVANLIASGLFGDGAAAVLVGGGDRPGRGPRVVATRSVFYPDLAYTAYPWSICARVVGDVVSFVAWPTGSPRPEWDDATHGGSVSLPPGFSAAGRPVWVGSP